MTKKFKPRYNPNSVQEAEIETYLKEEIEKVGGVCIKGNPHNQRGMPDRICILPKGLIIFVECKRPGLKPRPNQRYTINKFNGLGHEACYINDFHKVDALITYIKEHLRNYRQVVSTDRLCDKYECKERIKP